MILLCFLMMDATYNINGSYKPTLKRFADLKGPDYFPTPRWATFALIENEKFTGDIWECACGDGAMSRVLEETNCPVVSSDLYDRGFGEAGYDFLTTERTADNVLLARHNSVKEHLIHTPSRHHKIMFKHATREQHGDRDHL